MTPKLPAEKTDYGGCPICGKDWRSYSWYVNCVRVFAHTFRRHWPEEFYEWAVEERRKSK